MDQCPTNVEWLARTLDLQEQGEGRVRVPGTQDINFGLSTRRLYEPYDCNHFKPKFIV